MQIIFFSCIRQEPSIRFSFNYCTYISLTVYTARKITCWTPNTQFSLTRIAFLRETLLTRYNSWSSRYCDTLTYVVLTAPILFAWGATLSREHSRSHELWWHDFPRMLAALMLFLREATQLVIIHVHTRYFEAISQICWPLHYQTDHGG